MTDIAEEVKKTFGQKLRVRVCGICILQDKILLVNHRGLRKSNNFWAPPGGGMNFGELATETLEREFREETGYQIKTGRFLFVNEFMGKELHAIELFFEVEAVEGEIRMGTDPELQEQIIKEVKFVTLEELQSYQLEEIHSLLQGCTHLYDILQRNGYICLNSSS
jgi:8-oxo-dGTP diphosphatase